MKNIQIASWLLTLGLLYVFGWFGIDKLLNPLTWVGWMPGMLEGLFGFSKVIWTQIIGGIEVALALGLLIPWIKRYAALFMFLHLIAVLAVTGFSEIGIRDTGLLFMAAGLTVLVWPKN